MKFYFGEMTESEALDHGPGVLVAHSPTKYDRYFYHCIEFGTNPGGTEEFMFHDSAGRVMPIRVEDIDTVISALQEIRSYANSLEVADAIMSRMGAALVNDE